MEKMDISVIIPLKNEEKNLPFLLQELEHVMNALQKNWELICIDDGSKDNTLKLLKEFHKTKKYLRVLSFSKNFGQSSAFSAGFQAARGAITITLDGDLQNDPKDIPKLLVTLKECDLVVGWRAKRKDPFTKRLTSKLSNFTRTTLLGDAVHDTGCSLKAYRTECLKKILHFNGMHRFLPALFQIQQLKVKEIVVNHRKRTLGKTKYHFFNRSLSPFLDLLFLYWFKKRALCHKIAEELDHEKT